MSEAEERRSQAWKELAGTLAVEPSSLWQCAKLARKEIETLRAEVERLSKSREFIHSRAAKTLAWAFAVSGAKLCSFVLDGGLEPEAWFEAALTRARDEERERCLDWIASEARDCGCSERIAAAIRKERG